MIACYFLSFLNLDNLFASATIHEKRGSTNSSSSEIDWLTPSGKCKKLWRKEDRLLGRCFGLKLHSEFPELSSIKIVKNALECRTLCCNLNDQCVTWQFGNKSRECKMGPPVRLGLESAPTGDWCEPLPPGRWNGKRVVERKANGECVWGVDLPTQCFGLGPEKMNSSNARLDTRSCQKACCEEASCDMWQEVSGRGCYFGTSKGIWCEKGDAGVEEYTGTRKCIPGFCGGRESEYLKISTDSKNI